MGTVTLRPLRVGEILDRAIKLYLRDARTLMGSAATAVVPLQLVSAIVLLSTYSSGEDINVGFSGVLKTVTPEEARARLGATAIIGAVSLITNAFVSAACVKAVSDTYLDQPTSIASSLRFGVRRLLPLLAMLLLMWIGIVIGFVLLIVPGIWLYAAFGVSTAALVIERRGPFAALRRSIRLVRGRWWATAGVLLVANVMVSVLGSALQGLLTALALTSSHPSVLFAVAIVTLSALISGILLAPFTATVTAVLYYDLRVRREGYDLQLLAEQLGLPEGAIGDAPSTDGGFDKPIGPEMVGQPGGPPYWPPPPGWRPET